MSFSEAPFLFLFLPVVLILYWLIPTRGKNTLLLVASLLFYAWGEKYYVVVMLISIAFNFVLGLALGKTEKSRRQDYILVLGVVGNLALLGYFKYLSFLMENINVLVGWVGIEPIITDPVHLPVGISFFTFQAISYLIDIKRGQAQVQKNIVNLALYISLFPQLIAGPIVRYQHVANQIVERTVTVIGVAEGVQRFIIGLSKKVLLANAFAVPVDYVFGLPAAELSTSLVWFAVVCYVLQLYFDFSGYSDMAVGLGKIFGFRFRENFNYPFTAQNVTQFWQKWHISLSTWLRDYIYAPLGGGKKGKWYGIMNIIIVFVLCGIWHGAAWNFVIFGFLQGFFIAVERLQLLPDVIRKTRLTHIYCGLVMLFSFMGFRSFDLAQVGDMSLAMVGFSSDTSKIHYSEFIDFQFILLAFIGAIACTPFPRDKYRIFRASLSSTLTISGVEWSMLFTLFLLAVLKLSADSYNPFIYFRF